ncbi:MAG: O-antigen ligase family protein [Elusimicrobiales bacterium]
MQTSIILWQLLFALAAAAVMGRVAVTVSAPLGLAALLAAALIAVTLVSPRRGLETLVFSMMLSPELALGSVGGRLLTLRYDDLLLLAVFFTWFAKTAVSKELKLFRRTPVTAPAAAYAFVCALSTLVGILSGRLDAAKSAFYTLKYIEYFFLFLMAVNVTTDKAEVSRLLKMFILTALLVTAYAYNYHFRTGDRATAPFDDGLYGIRSSSEPGTLGGYYLVVFGLLLGMMTEMSGARLYAAAGVFMAMFPAFVLTLSRASYAGFGVLVAALLAGARRRGVVLAALLGAALCVFINPSVRDSFYDRVELTFRGDRQFATHEVNLAGYNVKLEDSAAQRAWTWKWILFQKFPEHPFLGHGVTGVGFVDTQYGLILGELGIAGLCVFIWLAGAVYYAGRKCALTAAAPWERGLGLGLIAALAGLLTHAITSNSFITVKIMQPFWLLAALAAAVAASNSAPQAGGGGE